MRGIKHPLTLSDAQMQQIAGDYGERQIAFRDGSLWYARPALNPMERRLIPVKEGVFLVEGVPDFRLEIERAADDTITGVLGVYRDGHTDANARVK